MPRRNCRDFLPDICRAAVMQLERMCSREARSKICVQKLHRTGSCIFCSALNL